MMEAWAEVVYWAGAVLALFVAFVNIPLLCTIWNARENSLINYLIGLDCLVALLHIPFILSQADLVDFPCWFNWSVSLQSFSPEL